MPLASDFDIKFEMTGIRGADHEDAHAGKFSRRKGRDSQYGLQTIEIHNRLDETRDVFIAGVIGHQWLHPAQAYR